MRYLYKGLTGAATLGLLMLLPFHVRAHGTEQNGKAPAATTGQAKTDKHAPGNHGEALGEPGDPKAPARTMLVVMSDEMRFVPDKLEVKRGETIRFTIRNSGKVKHELVLGTHSELQEHAKLMEQFPEMEHADPNAASAEPGKTAALVWKFTKPGEFMFGCLIPGHFQGGMKGTIIVR